MTVSGERPNTSEYHLTQAGRELKSVIDGLGAWGVRWAFGDPRPEELEPVLLLWKIHRRIRRDLLPRRRTVVELDFSGRRGRRLWLVLMPNEVSMCLKPPGFDTDLVVRVDLALFYRVWLNAVGYHAAVRCGSLTVEGPPALVRELPNWFLWSPMAHFVRARASEAVMGKPRSARRNTKDASQRIF